MESKSLVSTIVFSTAMTLCAPTLANAQKYVADVNNYPDKPIRFIVPWVAGGGADFSARIITAKMSEGFNQQVVIDNRPGANGIIGAELAAKATPNGYTMVLLIAEHFINPSINSRLPYDTVKDFAPISLIGAHSIVLIVNPSLAAKSVQELVALAKSRPGELTFGSWGNGSLGHLSGELFKSMAKIQMVHIPYKGAPQAIVDIHGGRLSLMFTTVPTGLPFISSGKLRGLAVTSAERLPILPDVPTVIESGYPGLEIQHWRGIYVPAGTPKQIVSKLNAELVKILRMQDVRDRLTAGGFYPVSSSPQELETFSKSELERWAKVAHQAGLRTN